MTWSEASFVRKKRSFGASYFDGGNRPVSLRETRRPITQFFKQPLSLLIHAPISHFLHLFLLLILCFRVLSLSLSRFNRQLIDNISPVIVYLYFNLSDINTMQLLIDHIPLKQLLLSFYCIFSIVISFDDACSFLSMNKFSSENFLFVGS